MSIKKILLAEDDDDIRETIVEILTNEGYHVTSCVDGYDASTQLPRVNCDLLITDFNMPRMNGVELLEWCRKNDFHFPVIFITANRDLLPEQVRALSDCCADLLRKPIHLADLLDAIKRAEGRNHQRECSLKPHTSQT